MYWTNNQVYLDIVYIFHESSILLPSVEAKFYLFSSHSVILRINCKTNIVFLLQGFLNLGNLFGMVNLMLNESKPVWHKPVLKEHPTILSRCFYLGSNLKVTLDKTPTDVLVVTIETRIFLMENMLLWLFPLLVKSRIDTVGNKK